MTTEGLLVFHDLELDSESGAARRSGRPLELTRTEARLLRYLMLNANRVVSKSQILSRVWSQDFTGDASIVESYISQLRHKVDAAEPPLIHTKRGMGYVLRLPPGHPIATPDPGDRQREAATG